MKAYPYSIIYIVILGVINFFHLRVEDLIVGNTGRNFALYFLYALLLAFFVVVFIKVFTAKKINEIALILLTMGLTFFFVFTNPMFLFKLTVLELFILGVLVAWEGKKSKSFLPFLVLVGGALVVEMASNLSVGSHFYYLDVWRHMLICLSGYISGSLLN